MEIPVNPKRTLSTSDLLDARPLRNRLVQIENQSEAEMTLSVPIRQKWYMKSVLRFIFPFSKSRRIALDAMGMEVWERCDGTTSAEQIIDLFSREHKVTFHEARLSVMLFLKQLTQRGMIVMVGAPLQGKQ